jgi:hypothetical protein
MRTESLVLCQLAAVRRRFLAVTDGSAFQLAAAAAAVFASAVAAAGAGRHKSFVFIES